MPIYSFYTLTNQCFKKSFFSTNWCWIFFVFCFSLLSLNACKSEVKTQAQQANNLPKTDASIPSLQNTLPLSYRVRESSLPENEKAPLVIVLHGFGSNMDDLFALKGFVDARYTFVSLQAPYSAGTNRFKWYDLTFEGDGNIISNTEEAAKSVQVLSEFVDSAIHEFGADEKQVYLMGFSQGAMMSLYLALSEPQKIAGAAILSGQMIEGLEKHISEDKEALMKLSLLVTHGTKDGVISIEKARNMEKMLKKMTDNLDYNEYDVAHQLSQQNLEDITKWFENQLNSHRIKTHKK